MAAVTVHPAAVDPVHPSPHQSALCTPLHPADLIALESLAWAYFLDPGQSAAGLHLYQQATAEGIPPQPHANPSPLPPGHRVYRTSSW